MKSPHSYGLIWLPFKTGDPKVLLGVTEMYQNHHASTETSETQKILLAVETCCLLENMYPKVLAINSHPWETSLFLLGTSVVFLYCSYILLYSLSICPGWHRNTSRSRRERSDWSNWETHGLSHVGHKSEQRAWTCGFPSCCLGGSIHFLFNLILFCSLSRGVGKTFY